MTPSAPRLRLALLCALALPWLGPRDLGARPDRAAWMRQAGWGVMVHYLPDWIDPRRSWTSPDWDAQVDGFDVEGLARQVHEAGAGYVLLSIGQNSGFYLAPNATYDELTAARPSRGSRRDLVADLSEALGRRGLRLLVYLPSGPPSNDPAAVRALGWEGDDGPNRDFQRRWERVIAEWSRRWAGKVSGWWFDGCSRPNTRYRSPEPPNFASFAAAARAGNPDAAVAFSPGLYYPVFPLSPHEDYTAGLIYDFERDFANPHRVRDGRVDGAQLHVLSFLGGTWGRGEPRFTDEQVAAYTRRVRELGGVVTWDVPVEADGRIAPAHLDRLRAAGRARTPAPDLLLSGGWRLVEVRERRRAGDASLAGVVGRLRGEADAALTRGPWSVVDKTGLSGGADPHDYRSLGPYWWPDPAAPDGLPWVRRDGERNPQSAGDAYDRRRLGEMQDAVNALGLAYFLTGHEPYAAHAARVLRAWFLDPATRMNPHLRYAQAIPGRVAGRGIGIIDTARLPQMLDRVELLAGSPAWSEADRRGLCEWMAAYLDWLVTSEPGQEEERTTNNHGSWYDVQVAALAVRTGRPGLARDQLARRTRGRIATQVEPDGRQPRELERTRSLSYSVFNLEALLFAAALGDRVGVDLWRYETPDGRSLRRALDHLLPWADPDVTWPHAQITPAPWPAFGKLLRMAAARGGDPRYARAHARLPEAAREDHENVLLYPLAAPARADGRGAFAGWRHFRTVTLDTTATGAGVGGDVRGFPLVLSLDGSQLDFTQARRDGADLRFSTSAGDALPHAVEHWDPVGRRATVWVKVDVRGDDAAQSFLMHWGNPDAADGSDSPAVFDTRDGFVGVWHLSEAGGTAEGGYRDATANAAHATGVNLAPEAAIEGRLGRGVELRHAQGQWIKVDGEKRKLFDLTDELTFSIWAKARSYRNRGGASGRPLPGYETMFAKGDSSWRLQKFGIRAWHEPPADLVEICIERKDPKADLCVIGKTDMVTDRWFHFTGVHDHPQVKLYVNGALEAVETFDSAWTSDDHPVGIGNQSQFPTEGRFWDGVLDEARLLRVVKDEHWIKLDYESQREGGRLVGLGAVRSRF